MKLALLLLLIARADDDTWDVSAPRGPSHSVELSLTEGTWMNVTVHDDTLMFDLLGDIWSLPLGGGEARRLTSGPAWDAQPRFSPDGRWVAYVSDADGNQQVWVMRPDGSGARQVTHEDEARVTHPVWDPTGEWLVVRRRTVDTRSIGVTELWQVHLEGGKGFALTTLDAHPHAGEPYVTEDAVWFSTRHGRFEYNHDPVAGLWDIARLDRATGEIRTVVYGPGSAVRPMLSPDGRHLAFVSRDRTRTLLEVLDLETRQRRVVADWLDHDQMEGFALLGVYPSMAWAGQDLVLWAQGQLWRVGLDGARQQIPFHAQGSWSLRDVPRPIVPIPDEVTARVVRWPREHPADGRIAFSALGALWVREPSGTVARLSEGTGYAPAWSPDGKALAWTSWRDCPGEACGGALHLTRGRKTETLPVRGQLVNPAWSEDGQQLAVLRGLGGSVSPDLGDNAGYEIVLLTREGKGWTARVVGNTGNQGSNQRATRLFLHDGRIWFTEPRATEQRKPEDLALVSIRADGRDLDERTHLVFPGAVEAVPSPDFTRVAYKLDHQVHVSALPAWGGTVKTADGGLPDRTLTRVVGDWLDWSADGSALTWMEGPVRHRWVVDALAAEDDAPVPTEELVIALTVPRHRPEGVLALTHATVLTMEGDAVVEDATVVIDRDRIASVASGGPVPPGAKVIDLSGKTVIPGLVDAHAHLHYSSGDVLPEQEWRYLANLDYGVTTTLDPSASTDLVFTQAERVEAGFERGPRIYSTGFVLYGALSNQGARTPTREAALDHLRRLQAMGATAAKIYQQSRRDTRQWYVEGCQALDMLCIPEGGGDLGMNLGMVADGFHSVEHAFNVTPLYADVRGFLGATATADTPGTLYVPTLLVAYGGIMGENWYYQHDNPLDDARLLRHTPRRVLDARAWRPTILAQDGDWNHQETARQAAALRRAGMKVGLGAHGQLQGLGVHWELWALAGPGAMTPMEALHAATIDGAVHLGLGAELGSVTPGKLADLVVLDADPRADIRNTARIAFVVKNGEIWE